MTGPVIKDLVCLVADKNIEQAIRALLSRPQSFEIREISFDLYVHPESDPACSRRAHDFLRPFLNRYRHALVVFDLEGSGQEHLSREELEENLESLLAGGGWGTRAAALAIDPELEVWVWSRSPHVVSTLGWAGREPDLTSWLTQKGFLAENEIKPERPKEALEKALRMVRKPRSSSIYFQLAQRISFRSCTDGSFSKLKLCLTRWFSEAKQV